MRSFEGYRDDTQPGSSQKTVSIFYEEGTSGSCLDDGKSLAGVIKNSRNCDFELKRRKSDGEASDLLYVYRYLGR
jgi:hypothetical protein